MGIMEKMRLDGKAIFVTGGARGIGMNFAKAVAEAGADVAIVDMDIETAKATAEKLAAEPQAEPRVVCPHAGFRRWRVERQHIGGAHGAQGVL